MSMASTSVSKTESPGSNPGAPANVFCRGRVWGAAHETLRRQRGVGSV